MTKSEFTLPGAETFAQYLSLICQGTLTAEGPVRIGNCQKWTVKLDGNKIGVYTAHDPTWGRADYNRYYQGRIPGYVNELVQRFQGTVLESKKLLDFVSLGYVAGAIAHMPSMAGEEGLFEASPDTQPQYGDHRSDYHMIPFP